MDKQDYKYVYGPVSSWRLGSSLGIDPISCKKKICSFDCIYCQLGRGGVFTDERKVFVPVDGIIKELNSLPLLDIDYITFSGRGEPTLAKNLGEMVRAIREIRKDKIAILTNSSLLYREDVQKDLLMIDFVAAKLDVASQEIFEKVNQPMKSVSFDTTVSAIKSFRRAFKNKFALQIMFMGENKREASQIAQLAKEIAPDEVQINTPLRPCGVKPLSKEELTEIKQYFSGLNAVSVYDVEKKKVNPVSRKDTLVRRGKI